MTLYVSTLYQIGVETTLVGVFSTSAKALEEGKNAMREFTGKEPIMHDWDHESPEQRYYFKGFTLTVTETTLDQPI